MTRKPRIHYTETDKALMWDRWRKGDIANHGDQHHDLPEQVMESWLILCVHPPAPAACVSSH
jgi:hypothetical protein